MKILYSVILLFTAMIARSQNTQGFFLDDAQSKNATLPPYVDAEKPARAATSTVSVNFAEEVATVSKYIYGNNANIYMTQMVDQPVLLDHIKKLAPNVLRFPGGNISSVYFWNAANATELPADVPATLVKADGSKDENPYWFGKNNEGWTMSLDNYYEMLKQTGSTGIITVNFSYSRYSTATDPVAAAAHLAAEWVRYDNGRTKFWEIGNENFGNWQAGYRIKTSDNKDGQPEIITGALYGKHLKVFADSMRKAATKIGATIHIGAQLLEAPPASWSTETERNWNTGVLANAASASDFYIAHSYFTPYDTDSKAAEILATATKVPTEIMAYLTKTITDAGQTVKPIALTEWNIFAVKSKQMVSYISGMHAALVLGELIKNKFGMSSRWDLANAWSGGDDHGMFSMGDEPGGVPRWNPRPVYYYMYFFQKYFGDKMVNASVSGSADVKAYASKFASGEAGLVIVNQGTTEQTVAVNMKGFGYGNRYHTHTLTGGSDNGEFSLKVFVNGQGPTVAAGGPANVESIKAKSALINGGVKVTAPPRSVVYVLVENGENTITPVEKGQPVQKMKVYPNPTSENFRIDFPTTGFNKLELLDTNGRTAYTETLDPTKTTAEFHTSIPSGLYFIRVSGGKIILVDKLVAQ
ncbi:T9SS type A sorting domain-containing protein [Chryseolinea lacunae]|uniref:T9SS type A sorting domain-containing protein n=1 Tax=Chryseolinea lacunae TaxID=2801331 RepID=A0ABS1KTT0_9BACT|nr:T9SS type A sorting domain-containing protein [Chryseolinea lacunae]MBL0742826.1 T9SS type A sorting domain-containing protein [Chryseolinea lacunae]